MITDLLLKYSDSQVLTASGLSTSQADHQSDRNLGVGQDLCVLIELPIAPKSSAGNETYTAQFVTSSTDATLVTNTGLATVTIPAASVAGAKFVIPIAADGSVKRYTGVYYTLGGTNPSLTVTATMLPTELLQNDYYFPRGYVIL